METTIRREEKEYKRWLSKQDLDEDLRSELVSISGNNSEITDRFCRPLLFGTGGLRGVLGAGTHRMNIYVVAQATQGLADDLNTVIEGRKRVVIAHDNRRNGRRFAETAAQVLAANGIIAYLFPRLAPTPLLSFSVRKMQCAAGICVTASHNPAEYNGYKVYGSDGCQITACRAETIQMRISKIDILTGAKTVSMEEARRSGMIRDVPEEIIDRYIDYVASQAIPEDDRNVSLRVVYTPLHGAGLECVLRILKRVNADITVVPSQAQPDSRFPTCPYPNPEETSALDEGIKLCAKIHPDILLATDPDCDRAAVAVPENHAFRHLSGNEVGVLLFDFICQQRVQNGTMPENPVAFTTIVSTDMADEIAERWGVELRRTLTGFKYIGELIGKLELHSEAERFLFGFEESCGYLTGTDVRDKDGVNACMLIVQMARFYKAKGLTLGQSMDRLYEQYGFYQNKLITTLFPGMNGLIQMNRLIEKLRKQPPEQIANRRVVRVKDYLQGLDDLPQENVLSFELENQGKVIIRPSGTEPKLKAYLFVKAQTWAHAQHELDELSLETEHLLHMLPK